MLRAHLKYAEMNSSRYEICFSIFAPPPPLPRSLHFMYICVVWSLLQKLKNRKLKRRWNLKDFTARGLLQVQRVHFHKHSFCWQPPAVCFICNRISSGPLQTEYQLRDTLCSQMSHPLHFLQRRAGALWTHFLFRRFAARVCCGSMQQNRFLQTLSDLSDKLRAMAAAKLPLNWRYKSRRLLLYCNYAARCAGAPPHSSRRSWIAAIVN